MTRFLFILPLYYAFFPKLMLHKTLIFKNPIQLNPLKLRFPQAPNESSKQSKTKQNFVDLAFFR